MTRRSTTPRVARRSRGFVILIVLVVLAILSAVVVSQFSVVTSNAVVGVRSADDAKARALAESCLTMMQSYVDAFLGSPIPAGKDFDDLLNPDGAAAIAGTEFLPPVVGTLGTGTAPVTRETRVLLPKGLSGTTDFKQRHTWLLIPRDVGSEKGACLVRFDDNSDETVPLASLPSGASDDDDEGLEEVATTGSTADNPFKDRDRAIFLTAVGLFPLLPTTPAADAYAAAHARVTLRRLFSTTSTGAPTIHAGGDVTGMKGALCSAGVGLLAKSISRFKAGGPIAGCGCGQLIAETTPDAPTQCSALATPPPDCPCAAVSVAAAPFDTPALTTRLSSLRPPGDWTAAAQAEFVFANQSFGPAPPAGSTPPAIDVGGDDLGGGKRSCKLHFANNGDVYVWDRNQGPACANVTTDPVPRPCSADWTSSGTRGGALTGSCTAAGTTKCWRRIHDASVDGAAWVPNSTAAIPNVAGTRRWNAASASDPAYLCGDPALTPCTACGAGASSGASFAGGVWTFTSPTDGTMPVPAYLLVENAPLSATTVVTSPGAGVGPLHATFVTAGGLTIDSGPRLCGVGCDCSAVTAAFAASPTCDLTSAIVRTLAPEQCAAARAFGTCTMGSAAGSALIVGDVRCGTIDDEKDDLCYVGNVAAMSTDPAARCSAPLSESCLTDIHFCQKQVTNVVGDVYSATSILLEKPSTLTGIVAAQGSFCSRDDMRMDGSLVVGANAGFKAGPVFSSASGLSVSSLRAMIETTW